MTIMTSTFWEANRMHTLPAPTPRPCSPANREENMGVCGGDLQGQSGHHLQAT